VTTRREFIGGGVQLALAATCGALVPAGGARGADAFIRSTALARGIWLLDGAGCNIVVLQGPEGSLLVDGGYAKQSKALLQAASKATGNARVHTLINSHWHPAQTGSNESIGRAGGVIIAHEVTRKYLARPVSSADYDGLYGPLKPEGLPTMTTRTTGTLDFAAHHIDYGYLPAAHTNGDLYIHLPDDNLLIAGGPVQSAAWPLLDWRNGAWLGGLVKAHEKLAKLAKPDTRVIPANGPPLSGADLARQHEMFATFHEKMVVFQNKGYDSGDCIAARPLKEFEAQHGDASKFVYGAFQSLNLAYSPD
jgi:glyoxylase-like metal-dependent hydrolase (beta-lactamase superfamily II)